MKIKPFLLITYGIAGLFISLFSAFMTYIIIDEPIGLKMTSQIALVILSTLPIIGVFSYFMGVYLSKKFEYISLKLNAIDADKFQRETHKDSIQEITTIHSSIRHLSTRLQETISTLQTNNKNLNSVIKSLSHDIKTPLTIMNGYIEELEDGLVQQKEIPKVLKILKKETAYLNELSSEVIGYIQSQEFTSQTKENILVKEFLYTEVYPLLRLYENIELKCEIEDENIIIFNPIALKKILINLLHNATKFTSKGSITTKMKNNTIIIEDTGIGIKLEAAKTIFEPFISLDESKNRDANAFGLGLSIASNLAKNNAYTLKLDNSYTHGCRFILSSGTP